MSNGSARLRWLKFVVSAILVGILWKRYGADDSFRATFLQLRPFTIVQAMLVVFVGLCLSALRWKLLLRAVGVPLSFARSLRLYVVGYFFNLFLPTSVGGDVVRALGAGAGRLTQVGGSIVVERLVGFGALLVVGIVASLAMPELAIVRNALLGTAALFLAGVAVLAFVPLPEIRNTDGWIGRTLDGLRRTALEVRTFGFHGPALAAALVLSLGWQACLVATNVLLAQGLGGVAPWQAIAGIVPVVQALTMLPITFGGLGLREMGYEYFFEVSGYPASSAVALGAAMLVVTVCLAAIGGIVYLAAPVRATRTP